MKKVRLKSIMALSCHTNKDLAKLLGISVQSVTNKINENGTEFKRSEIEIIIKTYDLTAEQVMLIFFD